jgi:hypothetical protein
MEADSEKALEALVFCDGAYKSFGEVTVADSRLRAEELGEAGSWGPLSRVVGVATAWHELAEEMNREGAKSVGALDPETVLAFARRLWVVPPRGSLL